MRRIRVTLIIIVLFIIVVARGGAQQFDVIPSASGAASVLSDESNRNPARLAVMDHGSVSFMVEPSKFSMRELNTAAIGGACKLGQGSGASAMLAAFGNTLLSQLDAEVAGGCSLTGAFAVGASIGASRLSVRDFDVYWRARYSLGASMQMSRQLVFSAVFKNITGSYFPGGGKSVESGAIMGAGYRPDSSLAFDADVIVDINGATALALAARYDFPGILALRLAARSNPRSIEMGIVMQLTGSAGLEANFNYHDVLGFSPVIGIIFVFGE